MHQLIIECVKLRVQKLSNNGSGPFHSRGDTKSQTGD